MRKWGYINRDGDIVIPFQLEQPFASPFRNGLAPVKGSGDLTCGRQEFIAALERGDRASNTLAASAVVVRPWETIGHSRPVVRV